MKERRRIQVRGIVQGVGFRPFVYGLATRAGLAGEVRNDGGGVTIEVEGETAVLDDFTAALAGQAPPLAVVEQLTSEPLPRGRNGRAAARFAIVPSPSTISRDTLVSPDIATCEACRREMFDPRDRRYRYPFINCTHCGPRFTIIRELPYDRPATTMAGFAMCPACLAEYDDPGERRFHAQPIACPACGPTLWLDTGEGPEPQGEAIATVRELLAAGKIVALKGLGGYHLACDATDEATVRRLRARKGRPDKPLALMAADLDVARAVCEVTPDEAALLTERRRPIVLLHRRARAAVAPAVAPGQARLGIMLPYTPLHELLLADAPCPLLVMTSANYSGEPLVYSDEAGIALLGGLADAVLGHDRPIETRCDDSVAAVDAGRPLLRRRSRGYAPRPLALGFTFPRPVLAFGGQLKNSFCLGKGAHAIVSHHIGDLDGVAARAALAEGIAHYSRLFDVQPEVVAHDLHPDYASTRYALSQGGMTAVAVQHHHAHIAAVLAEHKLEGPVIGVAFDGSGFGTDGTVWGGEFLVASRAEFERPFYLRPVPLPGGEQAVRQPWRMAAAWLETLYGEAWPVAGRGRPWAGVDPERWPVLRQMMARRLNCPPTSSMGRLFDAVAALVGLRREVTYEGQAAIELEAIVDESVDAAYEFELAASEVDPAPLFDALLADLRSAVPAPVIAAKFHNGVAGMVTAVCRRLRAEHGLETVALSGGVFQNALLLTRTTAALREAGFAVFTNEEVPANDGGLALGQAAVAAAQIAA